MITINNSIFIFIFLGFLQIHVSKKLLILLLQNLTMSGVYVTTITPFNPDQSLDKEGIAKLTEFLVSKGVKHLVPLGTAGEFSSLTIEEKKQVIDITVKNAGNVDVIPGVSSTSYEDVIELAKYAKNLGLSTVLLLPPYYFKIKKGAMKDFIENISSKCDINFFIYNNPQNVGYDLSVEEMIDLSYIDVVKGFKDSRSNLLELKKVVESVKKDKIVLEGLEEYALFGLMAGAQGYTTSLGNFLPEMVLQIYDEWINNNIKGAIKLNDLLLSYRTKFLGSSQPLMMHAAKLGLKKRGIIKSDRVRTPLMPLTKEEYDSIELMIDSLLKSFNIKV